MDLRALRPVELVRFINGVSDVGLTQARVRKHLDEAGGRIGSGGRIHLLKYAAWLRRRIHERPPAAASPDSDAEVYAAIKERSRARNISLSRTGRDIGPIPPVADPARRTRAERDLRFALETYFPHIFVLPWCRDHLSLIENLQTIILAGGLKAFAMPRGSGKTVICECAIMWAVLIGAHAFPLLLGASAAASAEQFEDIKTEFEENELLLADFPEVVWPIQALKGIGQAARGQLCDGKRTRMSWTSKRMVLPTIPGSRASGAAIRVASITGRMLGMKHKRVDGSVVRPSCVLADDLQTDISAASPLQCASRERTLMGGVLGLAGPKKRIALLMPCTVKAPGDLADRMVDRKLHPEFNGERTKLIYVWPTNEPLWEEYARLRAESFRQGGDGKAGTDFYAAHRAACGLPLCDPRPCDSCPRRATCMDAGALVAWPERFEPQQLSAVQFAADLRLRDARAFASEYQNQPLPPEEEFGIMVPIELLAGKLNALARGVVPKACQYLSCHVDVHDRVLVYLVAALDEELGGAVIDYGFEPEQPVDHFAAARPPRTLAQVARGAGREGAVLAGLERLVPRLLKRDWQREDGAALRIGRLLIDAGYLTELIKTFCRRSEDAALIMPSHGRFVGATSVPFDEYKSEVGAKAGFHWRIPPPRKGDRHVLMDINFFKTFAHQRLAVALGDKGSLSVFGRRPEEHRMLFEHWTAERPKRASSGRRVVDEWRLIPNRENHLLDNLVGCLVGASMLGAAPPGAARPAAAKRRRWTAAGLQ